MEHKKENLLGCFLFSMIGFIGFLLTYHQLVSLNWLIELFFGGISLAIMMFLFYKKKYFIYFYTFGISLLIAFISSFKSIYYGFFGIINYFISWYNVRYEDAINLFYEKMISNYDIQMASFIVIAFVCLFLLYSLYQKKVIRLVVVTLIWMALLLYLNRINYYGYSLLFICLITSDMYYHNGVINKRILHWLIIFIISFGIISVPLYQENITIQTIKKEIESQIEELRYGKDTLPQGNLIKAKDIHSDETTRLKVTVSKKKNLYLKGFVGSRLIDNQWIDLKRASYNGKHEGMLPWLEKQNFSQSYQYDLYQQLSSLEDTSQTVKIEAINANKKYLYMPYGTTQKTIPKNNISKDLNLKAGGLFGKQNYSFKEESSFSPSELTLGQDWLNNPNTKQQKYLEHEAVYRQFVYEQYTKVDKRYKTPLKQLLEQEDFENTGLYSICQHIRDVMSKNLNYSDEINSEGEDVLLDFLQQKTSGNDVLFASLATEAFRYYQIPARYVEGYYVKSSDINDHGIATIASKNAHAWVEVYFDGMGWLPVDMTPGYYYDVYTLMNMVSSPQGNQNDVDIQKNQKESSQVDDGQSGGGFQKLLKNIKDVGMVSLGVLTGLILLIFILWLFLEIRKYIYRKGLSHAFKHATVKDQTAYLYCLVVFYLKTYDIDYHLGLNNEQIDEQLSLMEVIYNGDFLRICELFEKSFYGEIALQEYELLIIAHFINVLYKNQRGLKWYERIIKRYTVMSWRRVYKELVKGRLQNG